MNTTYQWLFDNYARKLQEEFKEFEEEAISQLGQMVPLSNNQRIKVEDFLGEHRFRCGVESFALGVQFGLRLTTDFWMDLSDPDHVPIVF